MTTQAAPRRRLSTFALGVALTSASMTGCSVALSQPPPARPIRFVSECSSSYLPVVGDGFWALNAGGVALLAFGAAALQHGQASTEVVPSWKPQPQADANVPALMTIGMIATATTVALIQSARYGARSADACEAARTRLMGGTPFGWPPYARP